MNNNCEFCKKSFYDISTLNKHLKSAKKCIKLRETLAPGTLILEEKFYGCVNCSKKFTTNQNLKRHLENCKTVINVEKLVETVEVLSQQIKELKDKPTTSTTINNNGGINQVNITNHIGFREYMTHEKIESIFNDHYTIQKMMEGQEGLADFTIEFFLNGTDKPMYFCSDKSRNSFYFLDSNKKRVNDPDGKIMSRMIYASGINSIREKFTSHCSNTKAISSDLEKNFNSITNLKEDDKTFTQTMAKKLPKSEKTKNLDKELDEAFEKRCEEMDKFMAEYEKNKPVLNKDGLDIREVALLDYIEETGNYNLAGVSRSTCKHARFHYKDTGEILQPRNLPKEHEERYKAYLTSDFVYYTD